jgi:hypothetical protein
VKKSIIVLAALLLSGCMTSVLDKPRPTNISTPSEIIINGETIGKAPPPKVPELPASLAKKAGQLPALTDPTVAGQTNAGVVTDRMYNDVAHQLNNVIDVYLCVYDAMNNDKDAKACLKGK